jgi:hypothetical protein
MSNLNLIKYLFYTSLITYNSCSSKLRLGQFNSLPKTSPILFYKYKFKSTKIFPSSLILHPDSTFSLDLSCFSIDSGSFKVISDSLILTMTSRIYKNDTSKTLNKINPEKKPLVLRIKNKQLISKRFNVIKDTLNNRHAYIQWILRHKN